MSRPSDDLALGQQTAVVLEHSPYPAGRGSDVYCCGTCGVILARCLAGDPLEQTVVVCRVCGTRNHAACDGRPPAPRQPGDMPRVAVVDEDDAFLALVEA